MGRTNHNYEKRKREIAKQKKREEKRLRKKVKREAKAAGIEDPEEISKMVEEATTEEETAPAPSGLIVNGSIETFDENSLEQAGEENGEEEQAPA